MPTLFISYSRRDTVAVARLVDDLKMTHYRCWFDRNDIHVSEDWQLAIDLGIDRSDAIVLCLSATACMSPNVKYEVDRAKSQNKPIFAVKIAPVPDAELVKMGVDRIQFVDFSEEKTDAWEKGRQRLLDDLVHGNQRVSPHDLRQQRDRNNPKYVLHQTYLKQLAERIGTLNLAQINPEQTQAVYLEDVYVDSPTGLNISIEVKDWQVIDWWLSRDKAGRSTSPIDSPSKDRDVLPRTRPEELGYERPPFEALVGGIDEQIANFRKEHPDAKSDKLFSEDFTQHNPWNNGTKYNNTHLHLNHLAAACDRLVILGAPGSGKSTFVKYLALCLAGSGIEGWTRSAKMALLDNWPHGALTPVYIELRRFVASKHFPTNVKTPATADHLWAYIQQDLLGEDLREYAEDLRYDLDNGHAVLILDGLDEVPYPESKLKARQQQLIGLAQSINTRFANSRVLVASRPHAYEGWTLPGFNAVMITAFEDEHRVVLSGRLYRAAGLDKSAAQEKAQALNDQLEQIDPELKDRPLFVTLMAIIYLKGATEGLPTRRGVLYRASIMLLLDRWTQGKTGTPSLIEILDDQSLDDLYKRLAALAYDVHSSYGDKPGTPEIDESLLYKHLKPLGRTVAAELIPYLSENAGVLVSPGQDDEKDVFHFAHRTFQEYLAGAHLISLCADADSFSLLAEQMMSKPDVWRMPCTLAGDVLADTDRKNDLWQLIGELLEDDPPRERDTVEWWVAWLAGTIAVEQELHTQTKLNRRTEQPIRDGLVEWLVKLIEVGALPPVERAGCGRALGLLGDTRQGVGLQPDGLPEIKWCDVPVPPDGKFMMGDDDQDDNPRREVELKQGFRMAKYKITYQQFQAFIDSGEYEDAEWWAEMPEEYQRQPMTEQNNQYQNHPRENVSWYQAVAFTRWLTTKYRGAELIGEHEEIRLPIEQEWEYAARGTDGRAYPYGNDFGATKCNTEETGIGQTSAVGMFPEGASPFGVMDMVGNVWEWIMNDYSKPEIVDGYGNGEPKVVRAGSFAYTQASARASFRYFDLPGSDYAYYGFRVVLGFPIRQSGL